MADNQSDELFGQTPWQTVGPFFHFALPWRGGADLVGNSDLGARPELFSAEHDLLSKAPLRAKMDGAVIELRGVVRDGDGAPVPDAMIETWQADPSGRLSGTDFVGFGRSATDTEGVWRLRTYRPGVVLGLGSRPQAPHLVVGVLGRGLIKRLVTRIYFADSPENADDPVLELVPTARHRTLVATRDEDSWRFDIVLQGHDETVFFDI